MTITKIEDSENHRNAFEISGDRQKLCGCYLSWWWEAAYHLCADSAWLFQRAVFNAVELNSGCVYVCAFYQFCNFSPFFSSLLGSMIERILVSCNNQQDLHEWVDHLQKQTKVTSVSNPPIKPHSVPSHTVRTPYFCLQTQRVSFLVELLASGQVI